MSHTGPYCSTCADTGNAHHTAFEAYERWRDARTEAWIEDTGRTGRMLARWAHVPAEPAHRPCDDCPLCAVCHARIADHDPGTEVWRVVTQAPYGTRRVWQIALQCAPPPGRPRLRWLARLHELETITADLVVWLDHQTGPRRGPGARVE